MKIETVFYLTKECNFKCTYCYKGDQKNKELLSEKRIDIILKEFLKNSHNIDTFYLRVRGGEISINEETIPLIKKLMDFLEKLSSRGIKVLFEFSTNFKNKNYFKKLTKLFYNYNIPIKTDFSIHFEYYNHKNKYKIINKILYIIKLYPKALYRIVFDNFDEAQHELLKLSFIDIGIPLKFSNTYGLFLEKSREKYDLKILVDNKLLPLVNDKRISIKKFLKLTNSEILWK